MFLKNAWYVAAFDHEFEQAFIARRLLDIPLVMFRTGDGELAALEDLCPHRLLPLSCGKRVEDQMQCGYHGMRFDAQGHCTDVPGQSNIPAAAHIRSFPLVSRHGLAWIWMGPAELADTALIPDLYQNDHPQWAASRGYHHIQADYRLVNDNLLDLSHETYVHQRTIGNEEEESIANYPMTVTVTDDSLIRVHREMPNIDPPPFFQLLLQQNGPIHRWQSAVHLVPSINLTIVGAHPVDTERSSAAVGHAMHLLTPETESSTHYFWSFVRNCRLNDEQLTQIIVNASRHTFDEDKVILEVQQKQAQALNRPLPSVAIKLDEGPIRARRVLEQRLKAEGNDASYVVAPPELVPEHSYAVLD
ncbi:aromatic ring-hydroxylating dioxygenase subunit alpha [Pusillimonas sp. CC-YST705]|uniref:Aromatic ring-hydroxylating dioxygenase subunit alpha n=1 Tax=Mesopusillimonas faecipullorum TaxID=2755040 RepID=A0ABS8CFR5_9BURK|nr:aromatic ring-hydroxylating dioxygenase subunit alpha [Mesopusillimonas faecipullorum]MCB5364858.1 aromatic ring-hydroxylating dioxygenase subunit alpha [Mesopusillimonas faecipullorum]